jgi:hypothetical protein
MACEFLKNFLNIQEVFGKGLPNPSGGVCLIELIPLFHIAGTLWKSYHFSSVRSLMGFRLSIERILHGSKETGS